MISLLITIGLLMIAFKLCGWCLCLCGKVLGGVFGLIGYALIGMFAVIGLGLAITAFPIIMMIGLMSIFGLIRHLAI